jgi:hypothetical protein
MAQIRWRVILLLTWLTLFFNIERLDLDLGAIDTINLPTVVYLIGIIGALAALTPQFQRGSVAVLLTAAPVAYIGALAALAEPIFGDIYTYITMTSILLLAVTIVLSYNLGRSLNEFLAAVEDMTFSNKGGRLRSDQEANDAVHLEMISSRRRQRPLSLVVLQADPSSMNTMMHRLIQDVQRLMIQRYLLVSITRVLSRHTRRTDIIIEGQQPGRLVLLAPETSGDQALALGERLTRVAQERMGLDATYSVATFPEHALTYEELLNVAEQRLSSRAPEQQPQLAPEDEISKLAQQHALGAPSGQPEQQSAPAPTAE